MNRSSLLVIASLSVIVPNATAGKVTVAIESPGRQNTTSTPISLAEGESLELLYSNSVFIKILVTIQGKQFEISSTASSKVVVAGPATVSAKIDNTDNTDPIKGFVTFEVQRVGIATNSIPIPAETGTTWNVILEASSDLVNWSPASPGDYPSNTPQRYFRSRIVKK